MNVASLVSWCTRQSNMSFKICNESNIGINILLHTHLTIIQLLSNVHVILHSYGITPCDIACPLDLIKHDAINIRLFNRGTSMYTFT